MSATELPTWTPREGSCEQDEQELEFCGLRIRVWGCGTGKSPVIGCGDIYASMSSLTLNGADFEDGKRKAIAACKERLLSYIAMLDEVSRKDCDLTPTPSAMETT